MPLFCGELARGPVPWQASQTPGETNGFAPAEVRRSAPQAELELAETLLQVGVWIVGETSGVTGRARILHTRIVDQEFEGASRRRSLSDQPGNIRGIAKARQHAIGHLRRQHKVKIGRRRIGRHVGRLPRSRTHALSALAGQAGLQQHRFQGARRRPLGPGDACIVAELDASRLRGRQGLGGAPRDRIPLELRNRSQKVQPELGRMRVVERNKVDLLLEQRSNEGDVSGEPVELGDHQARPVLL